MPLKNYGLLKAALVKAVPGRESNSSPEPHYQLHLNDGQADWRIAINVRSKAFPSELLYYIVDDFKHPILEKLATLPSGYAPSQGADSGIGLDLLRMDLFELEFLVAVPYAVEGAANDLNEILDMRIEAARARPGATFYVWGESWDEPAVKDKIFGFPHGRGVHDVHMNQGNFGAFMADDGTWQDGALMIHLPAVEGHRERWIAVFLVFQSQALRTDADGHSIVPVSIVAAKVRPRKGEAPSLMLLNASPDPVDLTRYRVYHFDEKLLIADGTVLPPGATLTIPLPLPPRRDPNAASGGYLRLLDAEGRKVDAAYYGPEQVLREGWQIVF